MRVGFWLRAGLALVAMVSPVAVWGQFQNPTDDELKMTADPKAPGAAAVYLYREETVDDNLHYHSFYARIKVLTEKGKELATVDVPYWKGNYQITDIRGRTIHSDGTVILLDVKPSDLMQAKVGNSQLNKKVFTLPSVEVGSILEYRWQMRYDDQQLSSPDWDVQQPYFVHKAHYAFIAFKYRDQITDSKGNAANKLLYSSMLPTGDKVAMDATGKYTLDVTDVPAIPDEEFMPPLGSVIEQVQFYYSGYFNKEEFWKNEGNRWSKEMDRFANESKGLKQAVSQIVAPADSEEVKAKKIYAAVMALENTDYTRKKSAAEMKQLGIKQAKQAEDVWNQKSGGSDEIALLYIAMARSAGLKAYALTVANRNRTIFNPYFLSMRQLDDVLAIVTIDGKDKVLDPGEKYAAFGELAWKHSSAGGMRQSDKGVTLSATSGNPYKQAATVRVADLTVDEHGEVTGVARIAMSGPEALRWRHVAIENDEEEVKKQFNEEISGIVPDGVHVEFDHFLGLTDYDSSLMGIVKISGNFGTVTGKRAFLPGVFFESHAKHPFVAEEKRGTAVDMRYAHSIRDEVTYRLPESFHVESAPEKASIPWEGHAVFKLDTAVDKNKVTVTRNMIVGFTLLDSKEYPQLRDFYEKVAHADQQQTVVTMTPVVAAVAVPKGN
jgi:hypothetical protein